MAITKTEISNLLVSMFDAAPGAANLTSLEAFVANQDASYSIFNLADDLALSPLYTAQYEGMDNAAKADALCAQFGLDKGMFGLYDTTEELAAYAFFKDQLDAGASTQASQANAILFLADATNAAAYPVASATMANKQAVAEYYSVTKGNSANTIEELKAVLENVTSDVATIDTAKAAIDNASVVTGETISLSDGKDTLTGTASDDMFIGHVAQNTVQDGSIANALSTGDYIDGKGGIDEISATLQNDYTTQSGVASTINAITENVEIATLEVIDGTAVTVDAGAMNSVEEFWSDNSNGDLVIEDIRLGDKLNVTEDITFGIKDADSSHNFTALFESQAIENEGAIKSDSQITIEVAYEALPTGLDATTEVTKGLFLEVNFTATNAAGVEATFASGFISTDGTTYAHTYAGLKDALEAKLDAEGFSNLTVSADEVLNSITTSAGVKDVVDNAFKILIVDPAGESFTNESSGTGQTATAGVASSDVAANIYVNAPTVSTPLVETNLVLDNAGRGSTMGDVTIAGESNSDKAPEQINIFVDRDSAISKLSTDSAFGANNDTELQKVVISSTGSTLKTTIDGQGDLEIEAIDSWDTTVKTSIDASAFTGENLMLGLTNEVANTANNIYNVYTITNGNANLTLDADYNGTNLDSDMEAFTITSGAGNDNIKADLAGTSASTSTTASLEINAGNGNNTITLASTNAEDNKATVTTGSGVDTVTGGGTHLTVDTNGGDDVIYAENTGTATIATIAAGVSSAAYATTASGTNGTVINGIDFLDGREVQVTLGLPGTNPANQFTDGLEVIATVEASNGLLTTERDLNNAVAAAINTDPVLNKLATAEVLSTGALVVTYKIDGLTGGGDAIVEIEVLSDAATDLTPGEATQLLKAVQEAYSDSEIDAADITAAYDSIQNTFTTVDVTTAGTVSGTTGVNTVNGGLGNDVIVLSAEGGALIDTVKFDAGQFGNDTIVHFTDGAAGDVLDFSAWLNNKENLTASNSVDSQSDVAITLDAGGVANAITAGEVTVVDWNTLGTAATFDNMTDAQVLAALTTAGGFTVGINANLVGTTQNSLLVVQDKGGATANEGEYKVYQVVSDNVNAEGFTSATLVGSVDFSVEQTFHVDNF